MSKLRWSPPQIIELEGFAELPPELFRTGESAWGRRRWNQPSMPCFLEGPTLRPDGSLLVVDIAWGRILAVSPHGEFSVVVSYDGQPNGLAMDENGEVWIADASEGLLRVSVSETTSPIPVVTQVDGQPLLGLNDLLVDSGGDVLVTDQGDTGLHDPSGRVLRVTAGGHVRILLDNVPSPNGIALDESENALFVAATRDNAIWRGILEGKESVTRVGRFVQLSGGIGPDGIALTGSGLLLVAHLGTGRVRVYDRWGMELGWYQSPAGRLVSNVCVDEAAERIFVTESETNSILVGDLEPFNGGDER